MRKTGVLILVLLVLAVMANCAKENSGPAEATQEVLAGSSEAASVRAGDGWHRKNEGRHDGGREAEDRLR